MQSCYCYPQHIFFRTSIDEYIWYRYINSKVIQMRFNLSLHDKTLSTSVKRHKRSLQKFSNTHDMCYAMRQIIRNPGKKFMYFYYKSQNQRPKHSSFSVTHHVVSWSFSLYSSYYLLSIISQLCQSKLSFGFKHWFLHSLPM